MRAANGAPDLLRVVAAADVGDAVGPALLQSFARRATSVEATLGIATTDEMRALLSERLGDVAIGPPLAGPAAPEVVSEPLLRYRMMFVAGADHHLRNGRAVALRQLRDEEWLVDPTATDPASVLGQLVARIGVPEHRVRVFPTQSGAWAAAASGAGVTPAIEQLWLRDPHPEVAPLEVAGTPVERLWHVSMLQGDRRPPIAARLHRFLATPDATQAMSAPRRRAGVPVPPSRLRHPLELAVVSWGEKFAHLRARRRRSAAALARTNGSCRARVNATPLRYRPANSVVGPAAAPPSNHHPCRGRPRARIDPVRQPARRHGIRSPSRSTSARACPATGSSACPTVPAASRTTASAPPS